MPVLNIEWPTGQMSLSLEHFLPCSQVKMRKVLKVVDLDTPRSDEHKAVLMGYLSEQISAEKEYIKTHEDDSKALNRLKRWEGLLNIVQKSIGG